MNPGEVVVHEVQSDGTFEVFDLPAKTIGHGVYRHTAQTRSSPHRIAFDQASKDFCAFFNAQAIHNVTPNEVHYA